MTTADTAASPTMVALSRGDFLRAPVLASARPEGFKEWHHFVVHQPGWRLLANLSLTNEPLPDRPLRLVPRVVVITHDERWAGCVERFGDDDVTVSADLGTLAIGRNSVTMRERGYHLTIELPEHHLAGELLLTPVSRPFAVNNQPAGRGRLNWLFVPRLRAHGWFRAGDQLHRLDGEPAYHDHNWGRFHWGEDVGWEWGSVLPPNPDDPWSLVYMRMTDRRRLRSFSQALYVWRDGEPATIFRHGALRARCTGVLARPADCTLPPAMRLVLGGEASDVPGEIEITAARAADTLRVTFHPASYARVARPSEVDLDHSVVLAETSGTARVTGSVNGAELDFAGLGMFELLHG